MDVVTIGDRIMCRLVYADMSFNAAKDNLLCSKFFHPMSEIRRAERTELQLFNRLEIIRQRVSYFFCGGPKALRILFGNEDRNAKQLSTGHGPRNIGRKHGKIS